MRQPPPIRNDSRPIWDLVIADMHARDHLGRHCSRECASNGGQDRPPDPTPEEIAALCHGIQTGEVAIGIRPARAWDDVERRKRSGVVVREVEAPEYSLGELMR